MKDKQKIKTPEGVAKLMEDLWLNHKAGTRLQGSNVFWVELPPLSEEEKAAIKVKKEAELKESKEKDDNLEDSYGVWI